MGPPNRRACHSPDHSNVRRLGGVAGLPQGPSRPPRGGGGPPLAEWPMIDPRPPALVTMRLLHLAPLLALCSCNEGPTGPAGGGQALAATNFSLVSGVVVYAAGASGDVSPIRTITGNKTALSNAAGIARDGAGTLYVTNAPLDPRSGGSITVYAPSASGDAGPTRTIAGDSTGLDHPGGIALDTAGNVYVSNTYTVTVYAAGASGNVTP